MQPVKLDLTSPLGEIAIAAWESEQFAAAMFNQKGIYRLSISRSDASDLPMSWEELMRVKSGCGFGNLDAVEIYPKNDDVFNTGNVRHLYLVGEVPFALRKNTHTLQGSNPPGIGEENAS